MFRRREAYEKPSVLISAHVSISHQKPESPRGAEHGRDDTDDDDDDDTAI